MDEQETMAAVDITAKLKTLNDAFNGAVLSPDEQVIKTYQCSRLRFPKCAGNLTITTQRVIFHGSAYNSRVVDDVKIDSVTGISSFYGSKLRPAFLVFAIALNILIIPLITSIKNSGYGYTSSSLTAMRIIALIVCIVGATVFYAIMFRHCFVLRIYSSQATGSPIDIGNGIGGILGSLALLAIDAEPTAETGEMLRELGALISDVQNGKDYAIERWVKP